MDCVPGLSCTSLSATVIARSLSDPLPKDEPIYTCRLHIDAAASPGIRLLVCTDAQAFDPDFVGSLAGCFGGAVGVVTCQGDWTFDGVVRIDELLTGLNASLGLRDLK